MSPPKALLLGAIVALSPCYAQDNNQNEMIEVSLLALPEALRADATVAYFDEGKRIVVRAGSNGITCQPDDAETPGIAVWCYPQSHGAYAQRWYELAADGKDAATVDELIAEEIKSKTLEWPAAAVNYNLRGPSLDTAVPLTVIFMPFATGAALGITEERQFHRPWLMRAGTAFAHVMIPGQ